jgi:ABC-type glutathione transport system ATPase component
MSGAGNMNEMIAARDLVKVFRPYASGWFSAGSAGAVRAVDGVSFVMPEGASVGLAGESGCGKTTLGRLIAGLYRPTEGSVIVDGFDTREKSMHSSERLRRECRLIFQSLDAALNPHMTVGKIIEEPLRLHTKLNKQEREHRIRTVLDLVSLSQSFLREYPHTLSGGEKRRVSVARAVAVPPKILIADEPVSALDVSIRAQIIDLFQHLRKELRLTMVFISHDLGVLNDVCDRLFIMYRGKIVEDAPIEKLRNRTLQHPYSRKLIDSVLDMPDGRKKFKSQ